MMRRLSKRMMKDIIIEEGPITRYFKHWLWFAKESYSFMRGHNKIKVTFGILRRGHSFAMDMCKWDKLTSAQREAWYLSGEGRTLEM